MTRRQDSPHPARPVRLAAAAGAAALLTMVAAGVAGLTEPAGMLPRAAAEPSADSEADDSGFLDSAARCDAGQDLVAYGRTSRALVAICADGQGQLEYRGVRLSDGAFVNLPAGRTADGSIIAVNDGVTYAVSPSMFLVSENDSVVYRDSWIEFEEPQWDPDAKTSAATTGTTTVPTTTVTITAEAG